MEYNKKQPFDLPLSKHARKRIRQRGISDHHLEMVIEYGTPFHAGGGCMAYLLGKQAQAKARKLTGKLIEKGVAAILSPMGFVVTVEHVRRIPRHWRPAR